MEVVGVVLWGFAVLLLAPVPSIRSDGRMGDEGDLLTASYEIRLDRPIEEVWAFLTDLPATGRWRERDRRSPKRA